MRTEGSLWEHLRAPRVPYVAQARSLSADVLIVGGGITGAMIAETLTEAGFDTVVVDRRAPARGSTIASTALVQYEIDTPLFELTRKIGKDDAVRAWRRSRLAVTSLHAFFRERGIRRRRAMRSISPETSSGHANWRVRRSFGKRRGWKRLT